MVVVAAVADSMQVETYDGLEVWFRKQCWTGWFVLESSPLGSNVQRVTTRFPFTLCEHHRAAQVE